MSRYKYRYLASAHGSYPAKTKAIWVLDYVRCVLIGGRGVVSSRFLLPRISKGEASCGFRFPGKLIPREIDGH